jgi:hypothetical protein
MADAVGYPDPSGLTRPGELHVGTARPGGPPATGGGGQPAGSPDATRTSGGIDPNDFFGPEGAVPQGATSVAPEDFFDPGPPPAKPPTPMQGGVLTRVGGAIEHGVDVTGTALTKGAIDVAALPRTAADLGDAIAPKAAPPHEPTPEEMSTDAAYAMSPMNELVENLAPVVQKYWPSADTMKHFVFDTLGVPKVEPTSPAGKIYAGGVEAVPAALGTGGFGTAVAAISGGAGEWASQKFDEHPELARFSAAILTAIGLLGLRSGVSIGGRLAAGAKSVYGDEGRQITVGRAYAAAGGQEPGELVGSIDAASRASGAPGAPGSTFPGRGEIVPGSPPTTAQLTGNPSLLSTERGIANDASMPGPGPGTTATNAFTARAADQNAARTSAIETAAGPTGGQNAGTFSQHVRKGVSKLQDLAEQKLQAAQQQAAKRLIALGKDITPQKAGIIIRDEYERALGIGPYSGDPGSMKRLVRDAYDAIDPQGKAAIPTSGIHRDVLKAVRQYFPYSTPPRPIQTIIERLFNAKQAHIALSYRELQDIRADASNLAITSQRSANPSAPKIEAAAKAIKAAIDNGLDEAAAKRLGFTPQMAKAFKVAKATRIEMGDRFESGASAQVGKRVGVGRYQLADDEVPGAYFNATRGSATDAQNFIAALGGRDKAVQAAQDYLATQLRQGVLNTDGTINSNALASFVAKYRHALDQFPELKARVSSLQGAQHIVDQMGDRVTQLQETINKSALRIFVGQDPESAIRSVLGSNKGEELMKQMTLIAKQDRSGRALMGLRQGILDEAKKAAQLSRLDMMDNRVLGAKGFVDWLDANEKKIAPAFEPGHIAALRRVAQDIQRSAKVNAAPYGANSATYQNMTVGALINNMLGPERGTFFYRAAHTGLAKVAGWQKLQHLLFGASETELRSMFAKAALDPDYARMLAEKAATAGSPRAITALGTMLSRASGRTAAATVSSATPHASTPLIAPPAP